MSDHKEAWFVFDALPLAKKLLADKGYDCDWFHKALLAEGISRCTSHRRNRKVQYE